MFTTNATEADVAIVRRHLWRIASWAFPGAVVSDRSGLPAHATPDTLFLVWDKPRRDLRLPGLVIRARTGPGPIPGDTRMPGDALHHASPARVSCPVAAG